MDHPVLGRDLNFLLARSLRVRCKMNARRTVCSFLFLVRETCFLTGTHFLFLQLVNCMQYDSRKIDEASSLRTFDWLVDVRVVYYSFSLDQLPSLLLNFEKMR